MITFLISMVALIVGYLLYGRFVEHVFGPDDRKTPAITSADGVDYVVLPSWKIFMIQFLNIAGTGPIFGAILGAKFGPVAYLWIVFGCIFAGAVHDYLSGMLSMRHNGAGLPELIGHYLGDHTKKVMLVFSVFLLIMVGAVFVYSPAIILSGLGGSTTLWIIVIFAYYLIATLLPIDKIIGRIYPLFAISLLFMAVALFVCLVTKMPQLPELWDGLENLGVKTDSSFTDSIFPCLFITIACGAISGFHATQSPLMARCMKHEKMGRPIFYGSMITEGIVALIWATVAMYFFYDNNTPGYKVIEGALESGYHTPAPMVVKLICNEWLGVFGGILAMLGVVAAPITSGDTALRSCRLIIAEFLHLKQQSIHSRFYITIPLFTVTALFLIWNINNPDGFNLIWQYFGWANQTLTLFTLWMLTVYLAQQHKPYVITFVPAVCMLVICLTFILYSKTAFNLGLTIASSISAVAFVIAIVWFYTWKKKNVR